MNRRSPRDKAADLLKASMIALTGASTLASCDPAFGFNAAGYEHLRRDLESAWRHTASFRYMEDPRGYWKSPLQFERDGGGDCEDFAANLMYYLGEGSRLYVVVLDGHDSPHAIVWYEGRYLEPQDYGREYDRSTFSVKYSISFEETMLFTTLLGSKDLGLD